MTDERSERLRRRLKRRQQRADDAAREWACGIKSCSYTGASPIELIRHQAHDHPPHTCKVCHRELPAGFVAIHHALEEHTRAEFVKAYGASADDVRQRERLKARLEQELDVPALLGSLGDPTDSRNPEVS